MRLKSPKEKNLMNRFYRLTSPPKKNETKDKQVHKIENFRTDPI